MSALTQSPRHQQHGFSLVEIMVAMVIGLLGIIVIMQVFSVFESQKRTTTGGDDAQNAGVMALYGVERDISQAGYGLNSPKLSDCPVLMPFISLPNLVPAIINPMKGANVAAIGAGNPLINAIPADANTDTLLITYGNSNNVSEGILISNVDTVNSWYALQGGAALPAASAVGSGGVGFQKDDYVIADSGHRNAGAPTCNILNLTKVTGTNAAFVPVQQLGGFTYDPLLAKTEFPTLYNLGPAPRQLAYAIKNSSLMVCDYFQQNCALNGATWTELATGIVSMKAQCVSPAGIRLSLVARNSKLNPNVVTTAADLTWSGTSTTGPFVGATGTLGPNTAADEPWMHYRYKIFETFVPIRNAIWVGAKGC